MIAILGGLVAALTWSFSTVLSARVSRMIGSASVVAWAMLAGLVLDLPFLARAGPPPAAAFEPPALVYLLVSGLSNIIGLSLAVRALQLGKVGLATAICSTEGAVGASIAIVAGEAVTPWVVLTLAAIAGGTVFVALVADEDAPREAEAEAGALAATLPPISRRGIDPADARRSVALAALAALVFGSGLFATGQASRIVPLAWTVLPARAAGVLLLLLPLLVSGRLRLSRAALPFVVAIGACEIGGTVAYAFGAQQSVAVAAVLASQFAALAAVIAFFVYGERLTVRQRGGVVAIALGVALLAWLRT